MKLISIWQVIILSFLFVSQFSIAETILTSGQTISDSVTEGNWRFYKIEKNGADSIQVDMIQLSSDVDLYVRKEYVPYDSEGGYDCRPYKGGITSEYCSVSFGTSSVIHIGVHGWSSGSFKIKATLVGDNARNDECLSKSSLLLESVEDIPCLMRKKDWELAARLMDYWFIGTGKNFTVTLNEITEISEKTLNAINDFEEKANNENLFTQRRWDDLIIELKNTKNVSGQKILEYGGEFNFIQNEIPSTNEGWRSVDEGENSEQKTMHWFAEKTISEDYLSEYGGAFGRGLLRLVANGEVIVNNGNVTINVLEVGIYFKDSYDFIGGQFLGWWSYDYPYVGLLPTLLYPLSVNNAAFRGYNERLGKDGDHGDFRIFSNIKRIYTNESYYDYEIEFQEQNQSIDMFISEYSGYFGSKSGGNYTCYTNYTCQNLTNGKKIAARISDNYLYYNYGEGWKSYGYMN